MEHSARAERLSFCPPRTFIWLLRGFARRPLDHEAGSSSKTGEKTLVAVISRAWLTFSGIDPCTRVQFKRQENAENIPHPKRLGKRVSMDWWARGEPTFFKMASHCNTFIVFSRDEVTGSP